ncbi:hypothetical protein AB9P05_24185 [Roseivirga sp. BDSF3-8]|uniref:hypothetical protein n=1 Tax=Roseivirga sp. BDSF3-8 TaxID=3241598 RepID=UPI0035321FE1
MQRGVHEGAHLIIKYCFCEAGPTWASTEGSDELFTKVAIQPYLSEMQKAIYFAVDGFN